MCDFCNSYCKDCLNSDNTICCTVCCEEICYECLLQYQLPASYNHHLTIAKYVLKEEENEEEDKKETDKYRKIAFPDQGYICIHCFNYNRAINIARIMNGLFLHLNNKN